MLVQPDLKELSIRRQCELLSLTRSMLYYLPVEVSAEARALMKEIDRLYTTWPFFGSRKIQDELRKAGHKVNRKRVQRLMQVMGLQAMVPGPHTSKPHPDHPIYPYLIGEMNVMRPNQVWAADITYIPLEHGWGYLIAIIDWHSRAILSWRLSNTMTVDFCVEALEEALRQHGKPEVFNTDQGAQFSSPDFTGVLKREGITISMAARAGRPTTSSSSGSGGRSSTRTSICTTTRRSRRRTPGSGSGSASTTSAGRISRSTIGHRWRCTEECT